MADLASDVLALAGLVGAERFHYVGLSLGGAVGQQLALDAPDRLLSLTLACTAARFGDPATWHERAAAVRSDGMEQLRGPTADRWFTDEVRLEQPSGSPRSSTSSWPVTRRATPSRARRWRRSTAATGWARSRRPRSWSPVRPTPPARPRSPRCCARASRVPATCCWRPAPPREHLPSRRLRGSGARPPRGPVVSHTVVQIPVSEAETIVRRRALASGSPFQPQDGGVLAHITLLGPFIPEPDIDDGVLGDLERYFADVTTFGFTLSASRSSPAGRPTWCRSPGRVPPAHVRAAPGVPRVPAVRRRVRRRGSPPERAAARRRGHRGPARRGSSGGCRSRRWRTRRPWSGWPRATRGPWRRSRSGRPPPERLRAGGSATGRA
jgi:hypothetical protein